MNTTGSSEAETSRSPISIDPETGLKRFATRAASLPGTTSGRGYAMVDDERLTNLPELPQGAVFDAEEQAKYKTYKTTHEGSGDYIAMEGEFRRYLEDVHAEPPVDREALDDECEILVVGAGFAGLMLWYRLREAGFKDVRFCERGGDVGGTWYWNRYPGVACDVEAYSYLPLLEETGYIPSMKFASGFEILEYCQNLAERTEFFDRCLFHTVVEHSQWDADANRWHIRTDRGDRMRARYLVLANGILQTPKLARIQGMETFKGESFHTSRWNYNVDLRGKRVGIIGTGASAVQVIPEIAKVVKSLHVFQRTPSSIDVRNQRETTPEEISAWTKDPTWAQTRRQRYAKISDVRSAVYADDDYLSGKKADFKERKQHTTQLSQEALIEKLVEKNFVLMKRIRARIDSIVEDPATAEALKPYYPYGCKRPVFHDQYLPTFNLPHVTLVDTAPTGVEHINEEGVVHNGQAYPLDVLIYATGFQYMASATFDTVLDVNGVAINQKWRVQGTRTLLGIHTRGFPNLLIISGPQGGGGSFNFTNVIEDHVNYILWLLKHMRDAGHETVDVTEEAETAYSAHCAEADLATRPLRDCLSYYNSEGDAEPGSLAYYGGVAAWHEFRSNVCAAAKADEPVSPFEFDRR